jgi:ribonuclease G
VSKELIINSTTKGDRIALLQNKRLLEYHVEQRDNNFTVGDIYLGTVKKVANGLNAAFVDIGYEKDAFLHYLDLGPQVRSLLKFTDQYRSGKNAQPLDQFKPEPDIEKSGKITQLVNRSMPILVQVVKEPISTKGPRLSCELSLAGRYIVLVPFSNTVNVSKKIVSREERQRLLRLLSSIKPNNFGVIIRTVAEGKEVAELDRDLQNLLAKWNQGMELLKSAQPKDRIIGEMGRSSSILRDMLNESFDSILVDTKEVFEETRAYIKQIAPEKERILKLHSGKNKVFEQQGIEKQLKSLFGRTVSLPSGGYLIIEHTEALHVVDVNSGNKSNASTDQEITALNVNLEAVKEIARQLRLRDLGGIIVVDFIDMRKVEHKQQVYERMKQEMVDDRSKFTVLPLSKFGIMQITRQRVRPEMNIVTLETCPTCNGTGKISATILVTDSIEANLDYLITKQNEPSLTLNLHPFLYAYYTKGILSKQWKWYLKYKRWIKIVKDSSLGITDFIFMNKNDEQIRVDQN